MHKHKLGLAEDGRMLMCLLPDCRTGRKPFMVAGGRSFGGFVVLPDYQEVQLCDHELPYFIVGKFVKNGIAFCSYDGKQIRIYRLPNCYACRRVIRIPLMFDKNDYKVNRFCTNCGAQVLKDGKLVTA